MIYALSSPSLARNPNRLPTALSACQTCPSTEGSPGSENRPCLFLLGWLQACYSFQIESLSVWLRFCRWGEQERAFSPVTTELMINKKQGFGQLHCVQIQFKGFHGANWKNKGLYENNSEGRKTVIMGEQVFLCLSLILPFCTHHHCPMKTIYVQKSFSMNKLFLRD